MRKLILSALLLSISFVFIAGAQTSGTKRVFVASISGYDSRLVNMAQTYLSQWVRSLGATLVTSRDSADYIVRFAIISAEARRSFNLWILLFPLWPIVPFTTVEADVVLSLTIQTADGKEIFTNQAGGHSSAWWFADFVSESSQKKVAFKRAFQALTATAYLP